MTSDTALQSVTSSLNGEPPDGWTLARLAQLVEPSRAKVEPESMPRAPYLGLEHIEADTRRIIERGTAADVRSTKTRFHAGDVLYGKLRPYLNKVCVPDFDGICSTDILVFSQPQHIGSKYLMYFLNLPSTVEYANHNSSGVQLPRVSFGDLGKLEIPLPPLPEQERIVHAIERLTARVDAVRACLANVPKILKRFRQAVLAAACSGRLTEDWRESHSSTRTAFELLQILESRSSKTARARLGSAVEPDATLELPTGWVWSPLNVLCDEIVDCPHSTPKWTDSGRLCVRTTNFKPGYLDLSSKRFVSDDTFRERISRLRPKPGDLLYSREGGILGIACLIPPNTQLCLGQRMMLIRAWPDVSTPYVMHCLNSSIVLQCVRELTGGTASLPVSRRWRPRSTPRTPSSSGQPTRDTSSGCRRSSSASSR